MSEKRYIVRLSEDELASLIGLVRTEERVASRKRRRAQILLKVDAGEHGRAWTDEQAADAFDVHVVTVYKIRLHEFNSTSPRVELISSGTWPENCRATLGDVRF